MAIYDEIKKNYDAYLTLIEQRLDKYPNDLSALLHKAILLYSFYQEPDQAAAIMNFILDKDPSYVDAYMWCGEFARFFHGDVEEAVSFLQKALVVDSSRADCHALLAWVLAELHEARTEDVAYHYRKSFELEPSLLNPRFYFAQYLFEVGKFEASKHEFEELLRHIPDRDRQTSNPVEKYYEDLITGRNRGEELRQFALEYIQKIDAAEAASKMEPGEA